MPQQPPRLPTPLDLARARRLGTGSELPLDVDRADFPRAGAIALMIVPGAIRPVVPVEMVLPSPASACPVLDFGSSEPYMNDARRDIALPA